ncbi:hypothetical protein NliqN6_1835 [Naganishia liquefaciens]|uniref:Small ribosomal subunit protein mS35 mitochondrial conserved domain-containing protein n=1 Tax=Naganishia liquefaciens TaxID=104408 RepID=A0A8H3YDP5_9TREE|nr:hypothetical protein NliqN6_1835 [Naganishia liquefaciens]
MITAPVRSGLRQTSRTIALRAAFSTSSSPAAPRTEGRDGRRRDNAFDITGIQKFQFDDTTSYGHMILEKKREHLSLLQAIERDRSLLEQQRKPFQPPSKDQCLRFTTTIDLVIPADASARETAHTHKSVVHVPISRLPLSDDAAIHRFKLLAGPRWIPPKNVILQQEGEEATAEEAHGWFKMSQDSFGEVRLNRQWLTDTMQKLVQEANSTTSTIAQQELPLDLRHVYARLRKKRDGKRGDHVWARVQARAAAGNGGGVPGFPKEWL